MRFDWDPRKASSNAHKHRITFEEAITAFDDPAALVVDDVKHSRTELGNWLIGETDSGRVVVVVFTKRDDGATWRVISARPANQEETVRYEALKELPV